jgi:hypothetical protein
VGGPHPWRKQHNEEPHPVLHDHVWSSYATAHSTAHASFQSSAQFQTSTPTLFSIQLATFRVHHSTNHSLASNSDRVHLYTISDSNEKVTNSMTTTCCATCRSHHIAGTSGACHAEHRPSRTEPDTDHATRSQYFPSRHSIASSTRPEQLYKIHETVPRNDQCLPPPSLSLPMSQTPSTICIASFDPVAKIYARPANRSNEHLQIRGNMICTALSSGRYNSRYSLQSNSHGEEPLNSFHALSSTPDSA